MSFRLQRQAAYSLLVILAVLSFLPIFWMIRSSLMQTTEVYAYPPIWIPSEFIWHNYIDSMTNVPFLHYFFNTFIIIVPVLFGVALTSGLAAFAFARLQFPLRNFWFSMIIMTMLLPGAVTLIPTFVGWSKLGLVNTFWPLIIPAFFGGGAFNIFLLRQFLLTIPKELDESAVIDGANYFTVYARIILPLIKPALVVVVLFTFMGVWNDFLGQLVYLSDERMFTVSLGLFQFKGSYSTDWSLVMAASAILVLPAVFVFLLGQRYFIEGLTMTGIKG
jgi:multiple sugar transport system permease protein